MLTRRKNINCIFCIRHRARNIALFAPTEFGNQHRSKIRAVGTEIRESHPEEEMERRLNQNDQTIERQRSNQTF